MFWKREIRIHDGAANAFSRFKDGFIPHTHKIKTRETFISSAFNLNKLSRIAGRDGGKNFNIHNSMMNLLFENAKKMRNLGAFQKNLDNILRGG